MPGEAPNILLILLDDVGFSLSDVVGAEVKTPTFGRVAKSGICYNTLHTTSICSPTRAALLTGREGAKFTNYHGQQSCTAGRAAFITGQSPYRTGLTKMGFPEADQGLRKEDPTIAELLKPLGYQTTQFGKNHFGDRDDFLPTMHGFDESFGNLYHLNAEEEPENPDYPKNPEFKKKFGPRGVLRCKSDGKGGQTAEEVRTAPPGYSPGQCERPLTGDFARAARSST